MALVRVTNVEVLNNQATFRDPLSFEITFESQTELPDDTEWKIIYVGSAESESFDQELDSVLVGPVPQGSLKFVFQVDAPDPAKIPHNELLGVTVVLITGAYRGQEFIRIGYYVNVEYSDPELQQEPPMPARIDLLNRNILASNPRVTRFAIRWDDAAPEEHPPNMDENEADAAGDSMGLDELGGDEGDAMDVDDDDEEEEEDGPDEGEYDI
ncbi:uncharacterized protein MONBRDRAFT_33278 [Monosiga brevicollis MX1]|uniref:Histone chaperone n=1 Tax=Monosiga brevicollis TaxID=81824 RepID=A9V4I3_MONBE|nr:uncharacterized protein MONBRDRAFT_33278 [Monosiga brevicollis MX1]EDQ87618.1 predicted protein [Monosiga brevicollis MX1]|eukprot:XP_001747538.1 hypothetical protein [Monosiga brevicollis MX1]